MNEDIKYEFTYNELFNLLKHVYKEGYAMSDIVEAGLETYDPDSIIRWILLKQLNIQKQNE
jgi:hypothetical protein